MEHPLVIQVLERYVRKTFEGSVLDRYIFSPAKAWYLKDIRSFNDRMHTDLNKND